MLTITILACLLACTFAVLWLFARYECGRWMNLEGIQERRNRELIAALDKWQETAKALDKFRAHPGMETVSDTYARKMIDLQAENVKLTSECNELRLESAKYMDLYRNERYKSKKGTDPRAKYR